MNLRIHLDFSKITNLFHASQTLQHNLCLLGVKSDAMLKRKYLKVLENMRETHVVRKQQNTVLGFENIFKLLSQVTTLNILKLCLRMHENVGGWF